MCVKIPHVYKLHHSILPTWMAVGGAMQLDEPIPEFFANISNLQYIKLRHNYVSTGPPALTCAILPTLANARCCLLQASFSILRLFDLFMAALCASIHLPWGRLLYSCTCVHASLLAAV